MSEGMSVLKTLTIVVVLLMLQGCTAMVVGTAVGVVTTAAVETVKVPFKVTGAVIDVATELGHAPQNSTERKKGRFC